MLWQICRIGRKLYDGPTSAGCANSERVCGLRWRATLFERQAERPGMVANTPQLHPQDVQSLGEASPADGGVSPLTAGASAASRELRSAATCCGGFGGLGLMRGMGLGWLGVSREVPPSLSADPSLPPVGTEALLEGSTELSGGLAATAAGPLADMRAGSSSSE